MKAIFSLLGLTIFMIQANAQDATVKAMKSTAGNTIQIDTTKKPDKNGWMKGANFNLNLTQVSNSNWIAAGGDKFSFSTAAGLNAFASKKWGKKTWDNILDVNYGLVKTTTLGTRKINDRLDFISKFGYEPKNWKNVRLSVLGQLRSQLTSGYEYNYFGTTTKRRNSGFFAPAYIIIAPGIEWTPNNWFSLFGSPIATRWTIVSNGPYSYASQGGVFNGNIETPLATLYGVDPAKENRVEFGAFVTASVRKDILKNITYISKLDLYSNYLKNPANVDVFWTNQFRMKVNKFLQVNYSLDMLYDDDVKNPVAPTHALGLQVLSTLGVGFAVKL
jgi:hypothetical protein